MQTKRKPVKEAAAFLQNYMPTMPSTAIISVSGTGLSDTLEHLDVIKSFKYSQIPNFPVSTVESHKGRFIIGKIKEKPILVMQGRCHLYEGYSPEQVTFPVRVMQEMNVSNLILSNAAGGINPNFSSGDIMIITDHINLTGVNPLTGPNIENWGIRFPDMSQVYDPHLADLAKKAAETDAIPVQTGVYAGLSGPSLETPAETRFLKTIGCDAVGFSTVMEAIAGVHAGMKILGISLITNINDPDAPVKTTLEAVLQTAQKAVKPLGRLMDRIIDMI